MRFAASEPQPTSLGDVPESRLSPGPGSSTGLEIKVLGPFEASVDGSPAAVNGSKRRAVLSVLALSPGRVVPVESLMDVVWKADEPAAPRNAVQHHITRLRAELGQDSIVAFPNGYALGPARVDALASEDLLAAARTALRAGDAEAAANAAAQALVLFRGPALQGLPDTDWVCAEAARLDSLRVDALEEQIEAGLALGRHAELVAAIRAAVDESPFRERLHGQLMVALYRSGRQAEALEAFRAARVVLAEQLGLEPGPELRRLERAILAHDPSIDLPGPPSGGEVPSGPDRSSHDRPETVTHVLQLMRMHLRRAEELYAQAVSATALTP